MLQALEEEIKELNHSLTTLKLTRQGYTSELNDLIRSRTELSCIVDDLRANSERVGGRRAELEAELANLESQIVEREEEITQLSPTLEIFRTKESSERRRYDLLLLLRKRV